METPQVSGKVFRFLSAMHPSLSKAERKRYAGFDPDKWYPWTAEISAEFTDLMQRSPRDTSFARGFAYVAQRAVPEGAYIPTGTLLDNLERLPAAYRGDDGTGYSASIDRPGHAMVRYAGMPGFANACIAVQGELTQRLQATGAQSVVVKHARTSCRQAGGELCEFEVEWAGESPPPDAQPVSVSEILGEAAAAQRNGNDERAPREPRREEPAAAAAPAAAAVAEAPVASPSPPAGAVAAAAPPTASGFELDAASGEELFVQLRKRLAEADHQARVYGEAQAEIDRLRVELSRVKAQAEADIAQARKERDDAHESALELKRRIRSMVADD